LPAFHTLLAAPFAPRGWIRPECHSQRGAHRAQRAVSHAGRTRYGIIRILRSSYRENDRAQTNRATNGHIKIVTDRRGGIRGVTIVGAAAAENIATFSLAINRRLNIEALAGLIVPYPSFAEVGKRAAMTYFTGGLTSPPVRRIIGWLRGFG
jgi:hypothetical protein